MIIVNAFVLAISVSGLTEGYTQYQELTSILDRHVEWIDENGSSVHSKSHILRLLTKYTQGLNDESFDLRHSSEWKNGQCFKILHLKGQGKTHRLFFQCAQKDHGRIVTKIKVSTF